MNVATSANCVSIEYGRYALQEVCYGSCIEARHVYAKALPYLQPGAIVRPSIWLRGCTNRVSPEIKTPISRDNGAII